MVFLVKRTNTFIEKKELAQRSDVSIEKNKYIHREKGYSKSCNTYIKEKELAHKSGVRPEKFQFLEKWQNRNFGYKIVISVKNLKFVLYILDDKTDCAIGIVSQNLASTSNFVEFRDSRNLHVFRGVMFRVS